MATSPAGLSRSQRLAGFGQPGAIILVQQVEELAELRAGELLTSHQRVRTSTKSRGSFSVRPQLPVDVLGLYVYLPVAEA